jgi:hypothetical protein
MSGAPVTDKHRELATVAWANVSLDLESLAQVIADAEARGREAGIREALGEAYIESHAAILALLETKP